MDVGTEDRGKLALHAQSRTQIIIPSGFGNVK